MPIVAVRGTITEEHPFSNNLEVLATQRNTFHQNLTFNNNKFKWRMTPASKKQISAFFVQTIFIEIDY